MTIQAKQSKLLKSLNGIKHGFFTKNGGVSRGVYTSLNCSPGSNDAIENVLQNRQRVLDSFAIESATLYGLSQIHSTKVFTITPDMLADVSTGFRSGDAMITQHKGIALSVLGADCAPLLFAASNTPIIAAAHAGWGGAVKGIVAEVVDEMCKLGAKEQDISVCIGPCIQQSSYQVQQDFIKQLCALSDFPTDEYLLEKEGDYFFDLPKYLIKQCQRSGIERIENIGLDTYTLEGDFFSFRRITHTQEKDYGRQISVIVLN